jgi:hypothetical protein
VLGGKIVETNTVRGKLFKQIALGGKIVGPYIVRRENC